MAQESSFPSSQQPREPYFVNPSGNKYNIFAQVELQNRPKLVRLLRNHGANITSQANDADIILVDSNTVPGKLFIRAWSSVPHKKVLEYLWARKCQEAGKALLEADSWGGCETVDDGEPIPSEEDDAMDEVVSNPQPTPRETPSESSSILNTNPGQIPQSQVHTLNGGMPYPSNGTMAQPAVQQQQQQHQQPYPASMFPTMNSINPLQFAAQQGLPPGALPQLSGFPMIPDSMLMTFLDVVRLANGAAYSNNQIPNPMAYNNLAQPTSAAISHGYMSQPVIKTESPPPSSGNHHKSTKSRKRKLEPESESSSPEMLASSFRRKLSSASQREDSHPTASARKGKVKAGPSRPQKIKKSIAHSTESDSETSSSSASPSRASVPHKNPGHVFLSKSGSPFRFFVQVDLHMRINIVTAIKRNNGKIVNNVSEADYVILYPRSKTFQGLLAETLETNKLPLSASFVNDCVKESVLLDETNYVLEGFEPPSRKPSSSIRKSITQNKTTEKQAVKATPVKTEPIKTVAGKASAGKPGATKASPVKLIKLPPVVKKANTGESKLKLKIKLSKPMQPAAPAITRTPSPTPPPSETRTLWSNGRYLFTDVERDYFVRYAQILIERDPDITNSAIGVKMHEKMPHHPLLSWHSYITQQFRSQLENIRKKAAIARRKRESSSLQGSRDNTQTPQESLGSVSSKKAQQELTNGALVHEDLEVICKFFATGGGDDDDDEQVWANLAKFKPCKSAPSWPEFYEPRSNEIMTRIERTIQEQQK